MPDHIKGRVAFRTVVVRMPGGGTQYWFTDKRFSQGDKVESWVVDSVLEDTRPDGPTTMSLRAIKPETDPTA